MDTLTHGLAGALLGRAAAKDKARPVVILCAAAAMFPDCDAFFMPGHWFSLHDTLGYLQYHRGITHSFVLAPLFAAALAGVAKIFARKTSFPVLWLAAALGIASHIVFDWITSYGTMFWAPLSWGRHSLDWVFILDPFFTGILVASLLAAAIFRSRSRSIGLGGSLLLFAYLGFCAAMHGRALSAARRVFPGADVSALPQPFSPLRWALFGRRDDEVDVAYVHLGAPPGRLHRWGEGIPRTGFGGVLTALSESYSSPETAPIERFRANSADPAVSAARTFSDSSVWFRFARFPVVSLEPLGSRGTRLILTDLRFRGPWGRPAFQYEVVVSPRGQEVASGFVRLFATSTAARPR